MLLTCPKCLAEKSPHDFYKGRSPCKTCTSIQNAEWRHNNRERWVAYSRKYYWDNPRASSLKKVGITVEQYDKLFAAQDGRCAICHKTSDKPLHVDHDHACCPGKRSCGKCIRGLLCFGCNSAIGSLHDDTTILASAIEYLDHHAH